MALNAKSVAVAVRSDRVQLLGAFCQISLTHANVSAKFIDTTAVLNTGHLATLTEA